MSNIKKTENRKVELEETPSGQIRRFEQESTFISPVPDPQTMAGYEAVQAGFADRLLKIAEKEQSERLDRERDKLSAEIEIKQADISLRKRGQWGLGLVRCLSLLGLLLMLFIWVTKSKAQPSPQL